MIPQINIFHLVEGAEQARGLTVIIDVCRAFTTAAFCAAQGVERIFCVSSVEEAVSLREEHAQALLVGEVRGKMPEEFDLGNSPSEIQKKHLSSNIIIQRTSAGTQGIHNAIHAQEILSGAFVNAGAIVRYIQSTKPQQVSLVCMGWEAKWECAEDTLCAEFLKSRILGKELEFSEIASQIRNSETGDKFRDPKKPWMPLSDLDLCLSLDLFDFVLSCKPGSGTPCLQRIDCLA